MPKLLKLNPKIFILLLVVLSALPILFLANLLLNKTVNVPFWDQWELVPIISNLKDGEFSLSDYWQQHNEHRIFFPRLVMIFTAILTDWNTRAEAFVGFIIAIVGFLILCLAVWQAKLNLSPYKWLLLVPLLSLIWFSPLQQENWMWGWQIQWFLNVVGVMLITYALVRICQEGISNLSLGVLIIGGIIAQYSLGNGVLVWPLAIAALILVKVPRKHVLITGGVFLASTILYYLDYSDPADSSSNSVIFSQPVGYIKYVLTYIGRPLAYMPKLTPLLGLLLLAAFLSILLYLWQYRHKEFKAVVPWAFLGSYAIASAVITGISRLGLGVAQSYSSRYTTISSLLLIAVLLIFFANLSLFKRRANIYNVVLPILLLSVTVFVFWNASSGLKEIDKKSAYLKDIQTCTHQAYPLQICYLSAYPNEPIVRERLRYLKSVHWGGY